ncbi:MAG TPA: hypothetical protein VG963_01235, partial [Polyangiaceae bacterium]|nr:hypothetical protein [Polyangiaceae bacterium]
ERGGASSELRHGQPRAPEQAPLQGPLGGRFLSRGLCGGNLASAGLSVDAGSTAHEELTKVEGLGLVSSRKDLDSSRREATPEELGHLLGLAALPLLAYERTLRSGSRSTRRIWLELSEPVTGNDG